MYKSKNHSKFSLKPHLVFVTKYRKPLLSNETIANQVRLKLVDIESRSNFIIELAEIDENHIYILVDCEPKMSMLQIVRRLKQETIRSYNESHSFSKEYTSNCYRSGEYGYYEYNYVCSKCKHRKKGRVDKIYIGPGTGLPLL